MPATASETVYRLRFANGITVEQRDLEHLRELARLNRQYGEPTLWQSGPNGKGWQPLEEDERE